MTDIKNRILAEVQKYRGIAASKGYPLPVIPIDFSLKGSCAGKAFHRRSDGYPTKLQFNLELAARYPEEFLRRTVPHECSHVLQFMRNPNSKPHGYEWNYFCRLLTGSTMPRCHSYDTTGIKRTRNTKTYKYVCNCPSGTHLVSSVKHNRMERGERYQCVRCRCELKKLLATY